MQRSKNTIACEACRKRKGKCSGRAPCAVCQQLGSKCEFRLNRQRRGPRPRALSSVTSVETSAPEDTSVALSVPPEPAMITADARPGPPCPGDLAAIISQEDLTFVPSGVDKTLLVDMMCHLLELFWTHVNNQQSPIVSHTDFHRSVANRQCPSYLCYAMCAVSVKFSYHRLLQDTPFHDCFFYMARQHLRVWSDSQLLERAQSFCILSLYEGALGNGTQAWCDYAIATGLMEVVSARGSLSREASEASCMIRDFLAVNRCINALGYPELMKDHYPRPISALQAQASPGGRMIYLLHLLLQAKESENYLSPWDSTSPIMALRDELETFRIQHPHDLILDRSSLQGPAPGIHLMCALSWHCSVMLLNRTLLPLPCEAEQSQKGPLGTPKSQTQECVNMCLNSAIAVCSLCSEVIISGCFLLPPFLGYCCFQSSLVLVSMIRAGAQTRRVELSQNLEINFVVLSVIREFYKPTRQWMETLLAVRKAPISDFSSNTTYFGRFNDIEEPPFLPLRERNDVKALDCSRQAASKGYTPPQEVDTPPISSSDPTSWIQNYQSLLQKDLASLDQTSQATRQQPLDETTLTTSSQAGSSGLFPPIGSAFTVLSKETSVLQTVEAPEGREASITSLPEPQSDVADHTALILRPPLVAGQAMDRLRSTLVSRASGTDADDLDFSADIDFFDSLTMNEEFFRFMNSEDVDLDGMQFLSQS